MTLSQKIFKEDKYKEEIGVIVPMMKDEAMWTIYPAKNRRTI
jgi:hypothetical protein